MELVEVASHAKIDQHLYGQPYEMTNKYRETYHKVSKLLSNHPAIYKNLRVTGLGSTNSINSIASILSEFNSVDAYLAQYNLFEKGTGEAALSYSLIRDIQMPIFLKASVPIKLIKADILSPLYHSTIEDFHQQTNLLDFDSCSSLTGAAGEKLHIKLLKTMKWILMNDSIVHLNFVVKSFRVKSNEEEFSIKITSLLDSIRNSFEIQDRVDTMYQTTQGKGVKTLMGGVILKLRRSHVTE